MSKINIVRQQESELPALVSVQYINQGANYQQGVQTAKRFTAHSSQQVTIQCPIVFTDLEAKQIAEILMYNAWIERDRFTLTLPRKYAYLEPTDVFNIYDPINSFIFTVRIVSKTESRTGTVALECVADHAPLYKQNAATSTVQAQVQTGTVASQTIVALMDLPALTSQNYSTGYYLALGGTNSGWTGGSLYQSLDGGQTYTLVQSTAGAATMGTTLNALSPFPTGGIDTTDTLTVSITSGTLSSTNATGLANGVNTASVQTVGGYEIIQFQTATLRSSVDGVDTYVLSGLTRGEYGTEWATAGHAVGDQFVLLDSNVIRVPISTTQLDQPILYKAVSTGQSLSSVSSFTLSNTGVAIKPYAPVNGTATQASSGDVTISWTRSLRVGETSSSTATYQVEIFDATFNTLKRTITGITASGMTAGTTYTVAQQTQDFGGVISELYARIEQIDPTVGVGYPEQIDVPLQTTTTTTTGGKFAGVVEAANAATSADADLVPAAVGGSQWNPSATGPAVTLLNNSYSMEVLDGAISTTSWESALSITSQTAGKWYAETIFNNVGYYSVGFGVGTAAQALTGNTSPPGSNAKNAFILDSGSSTSSFRFNGVTDNTLPGIHNNDRIAMAVDLDAQLVWYSVNGGNWNNSASANPATGVGGKSFAGIAAGPYYLLGTVVSSTGYSSGEVTLSSQNYLTVPAGFSSWDSTTIQHPPSSLSASITESNTATDSMDSQWTPAGSAIKGTAGLTKLYGDASMDDGYQQITIPFPFKFFSTDYGNDANGGVFVGSNGYVTFGQSNTAYSGLTASVLGRALAIHAGDRSLQRLYGGMDGSNYRIRYEGDITSGGTAGSPTEVWELTFATDGRMQLAMGVEGTIAAGDAGVSGISNSITISPTFNPTTWTSYVLTPDANGANWVITTGTLTNGTSGGTSGGTTLTPTKYVSPTGSDSNPGTQAAPWQSFAKAVASAVPGDVVAFMDGTYTQGEIAITNSGTQANPITYMSLNKWGAVINSTSTNSSTGAHPGISLYASWITIKDFVMQPDAGTTPTTTYTSANCDIRAWDNGTPSASNDTTGYVGCHITGVKSLSTSSARAIAFKSNQDSTIIEDCTTHNVIEIFNSKNSIVRRNTILGQDQSGISLLAKGGIRSAQIYGNTIHNIFSGGWAICIGGTTAPGNFYDNTAQIEAYNCVAFSNVVVNESSGGCEALLFCGAKDSAFFNNTVTGFCTVGSRSSPNNLVASTNPTLKNNIFKGTGGNWEGGYSFASGWAYNGTSTIDYNDFYNYGSTPTQTHGLTSDPLLVNASSDWHLQSGSPCIGAGATLTFTGFYGESITVSTDLAGDTRTAPWSMGAYK
jgi:hypothetical protein